MSDRSSNIYVVDDEPAVLAAVAAMLEANGLESRGFASADDFLAAVDVNVAGCLITDVQMPGTSGVELQRRLRQMQSPMSVVVVSGAVDVPTAVTLMEDGAVTLLQKPYAMKDLLAAVDRALRASHARLREHAESRAALELFRSLSADEQKVLKKIVAGAPNKAIASQLAMSSRTVDRRRQAVLQKLQVDTPAQLAKLIASLPPGTFGELD